MPERAMLYPDDILLDLSKRFTDAHWAILQELCTEIRDDEVYLLPRDQTQPILLSELQNRINLAPQYFRRHIDYLQGASAIEVTYDTRDQRRRPATMTANGYRMVELNLTKGGQ